MRKFMAVLSLFVATAAVAATNSDPGFLIKTKLAYKTSKGLIESTKEFVLPSSNQGWTPLTVPKNGVLLLGRMAKSDDSMIHMEYILVDTRSPESSLVSTPAMIARLGEEAKVSIDGLDANISISLLAKKTLFRKTNQ